MSDSNPYQSPTTPDQSWETQSDLDSALSEAVESLIQTKPWVRFLSVLGFIASAGVLAFVIVSTVFIGGTGAVEIVVMVPMFLLFYFVPSLLLWKYASRINEFQRARTIPGFSAAITAQRSFWKYVGILMLVVMCLYAVVLFFAAVFALVA